ncbi:hypothetical protein E2C01_079077 [Portunus trituberculatus]|uniref:Secreted protein n=1 Tax=Portunus trituberculatus TaxID=210409 RepID=A0A5B7IIQ3_PORTR|nr:hypothetical protein [Portunus trituberculatus]
MRDSLTSFFFLLFLFPQGGREREDGRTGRRQGRREEGLGWSGGRLWRGTGEGGRKASGAVKVLKWQQTRGWARGCTVYRSMYCPPYFRRWRRAISRLPTRSQTKKQKIKKNKQIDK